MRNYLVGFTELGLDTTAMEDQFAELLGAEAASGIFAQIRVETDLAKVGAAAEQPALLTGIVPSALPPIS